LAVGSAACPVQFWVLGVEAKLKALICVTQSGMADDQVAAYDATFLRWGKRFQTRSL
jgi:hypothetical protein